MYSNQVETNDTASFDTADLIVDKKTLAAYAAKKQRSGGIFAGRWPRMGGDRLIK